MIFEKRIVTTLGDSCVQSIFVDLSELAFLDRMEAERAWKRRFYAKEEMKTNMSEIIRTQVEDAKDQIKHITGKDIPDDRAFSHVLLKYIFDYEYKDQDDDGVWVTDGANDGGIDFIVFDDEESKLAICQSKYTSKLSSDQIISELGKMHSTVQNFKESSSTGIYNESLKEALQNALDCLPDENADNIEYYVFTTAPLDIDGARKKIRNTLHVLSDNAVKIYTTGQIEEEIQDAQASHPMVEKGEITLDKAKNYLEYESENLKGIQCNVLSSSIVNLYNKHHKNGLFDLNIRRYIRNTLVDKGVNETLNSDRKNFWFYNNGIIIACANFTLDEDEEKNTATVTLNKFSIVNGGQTTTLIGKYKGAKQEKFYIPCKIVATKKGSNESYFCTKIAEATNTQKPICPRDLKSNAPEMVTLQNWLKQEGIMLEIKRGAKVKASNQYCIKNDKLGQLILSFIHQRPGTSRSRKKEIFDTPAIYEKIFKVEYEKDPQKKSFIKDLIELDRRYTEVERKYKDSGLNKKQTEVLKNGKQTIFALMGVCYRLANSDILEQDIIDTPESVSTNPFTYGAMISNYHGNDIDEKLGRIVKRLVIIVTYAYNHAYENKQTTSVSNFMKTDQRYYEDIVSNFAQELDLGAGEELKACIDIFKRS